MKKAFFKAVVAVVLLLVGSVEVGLGQTNISAGGTYTQNFDGLSTTSATWADNSTLAGWYTTSSTTLPISTGTTASGSTLNLGIAGTNALTDRAIGCLQSGGTAQRFGLRLKNNGVSSITSFSISFNGEQWRSFNAGTLIFEYQTAASVTSLTAGTWTAETTFDFASLKTSTGAALDGNSLANRTAKSGTLTVTVAAGNEIFFRWTRNTNSSPILAVDDLSVTANGASLLTPPTLTAASSPTVDAAFDVTFTDANSWASNITGAKVGTTAFVAGYTLGTNKITFTPSASNPTANLQTAGSKSITVQSTGFNDATVTQVIGAGAANKLAIITPLAAPASNGAVLATQPIIAIQDKYGNATTSTASVTAAVSAGTWTLGGTASVAGVSGTSTFTNLTAASASAVTGATIAFSSGSLTGITSGTFNIPAPPPANDNCSGAVNLTINAAAISGTFANSSPMTGATKNDVFYMFTPSVTGSHTITINGYSASGDRDLYIYSVCPSTYSTTTNVVVS